MSKSNIANILLGIACLIMGYFLFFKEKPVAYDEELIKSLTDSLHKQNNELTGLIYHYRDKSISAQKKIDSLQSLKPQIQIKYVNIYKKIEGSSVNELSNGFDSLFTNHNIK